MKTTANEARTSTTMAVVLGCVFLALLPIRTSAQDIFGMAIRHQSTSPRLMLVTIELADGSKKVVVTSGAAFLNALAKERGFDKNKNALAIAERAAFAGRDKPFRFTKPEALEQLTIHYSPEILAEVRKKLSGELAFDLAARLKKPAGFKDIYPADSEKLSAYRFAIAHVILEKGVAVQVNSIDGELGAP